VAEVHGTNRIYSVEILKNNEVLYQQLGNGKMDVVIERKEQQMENLAFYYVRVLQEDEEMAWSSPIWVQKEQKPV